MKRSVYRNLLVAMIAFGALVGVVFPPFAGVTLDSPNALSLRFWALCVAAGLIVGLANFLLFKTSVSREIRRVVEAMNAVNARAASVQETGEETENGLQLAVTSDDPIGEIQGAFNVMSGTVSQRLHADWMTRVFLGNLAKDVELDYLSEVILATLCVTASDARGAVYFRVDNALTVESSRGLDRAQCPAEILLPGPDIVKRLESGDIVEIAAGDKVFEWTDLLGLLRGEEPRTVMVVPLSAQGELTGLVFSCLGASEDPAAQQAAADAIRREAGLYVKNGLLHRKIGQLAAVDELTGLLNRRFGLRRLKEAFHLASRQQTNLGVVLLDIDYFKAINDTYGHDAGDAVLRGLSEVMQQTLRTSDILCRYGGEEFLVATPQESIDRTLWVAERLRNAVEIYLFRSGGRTIPVTISLGVACYPLPDVETYEDLVSAADKALYFSKENGRNCVSRNSRNGLSVVTRGVSR